MTVHDEDDRAARLQQAILLKKARARSGAPDLPPRRQDDPALLGEMQRGLWLAHQMAPRSPAYNLASAFRVEGPLDPGRLQEALEAVVSRHRLLRSTFRADGNEVRQVVHRHGPLGVGILEAEEGGGRAAAIREAGEPFDLESGPLVRLRLVEETPGSERLLLLVLHHILADERSLGFLWKELAAAYEGRLSGPAPRVQYDDYVRWLRGDGGNAREKEIAYWRRRLDPRPDELRLPFERPAEAGPGHGRLLSRRLGLPVQEGLRRLAGATGGTPFVASAFAFRLLLHRYTQGERTAFATPVSTRSHSATARMIGYFLNPVVISTRIDERQRVGEAVREFGRDLREILAHASVPFDVLAERLSPRRQRDRHPVFQSMFVYQETAPPLTLGGARLEPVTLDLGGSKFDLTLFVAESEGALEIAVEYRADRFDEVWMRQLLGHYEALLAHLPGGLDGPVSEVTMLGDEEAARLRAGARGPALRAPGAVLLPRQIHAQARRHSDAPAVTCGGARWSYGELDRAARAIARELSARDVAPGDRVGLFLDRSLGMVAGVLGCHRTGASYVPLDPAYPPARNRDVLEDAAVAAVLTTSALRERLPAGRWPAIHIETLGDDARTELPLPDLSPESPAYILYTSGSSGRPKGVVVTHGNLWASTAARRQTYDRPGRFLLVPSVAFDSSVAGLFGTLAAGGTLVVPTDDEVRDPRRLADLVRQERVSALLCVPSLYAQLLASGADRLEGLDAAIVAGESCSSGLAEEHFRVLPHVRLYNEYGPTEATVWATVHEVTEEDASRPVAIGRPIPGVRVDVLDALGRPVPVGIPGEAWIAGPTVAEGYWRRPELTRERFVASEGPGEAERRYRTGDRLAWTPDGRLLFLGRVDEQIKLRGFRIEPGEIEAALLEHPAVDKAAVVARGLVPDATAAPEALRLVAFVEAAGDVAGWREGLAKRLPDHMIPSRLVQLPELPRLPNGKVDRRRLRERALDAEAAVEAEGRVLDTREQALVSLWEGLLGRSGIGPTDNFFELGGHSLLVVEMTSAIERDFEVTLSPADVFEDPTVSGLARRIEQRGGGSQNPPYHHLFPIQPGGRRTPLIVAVPHFFTGMLAARFRGERPVYGLRGVGLRPEGNRGRWRTMTDLAEELVEEIRRRFPGEGFVMAGYSFGASMAMEAVRVMEERGISVRRLYVIAPMPLDFYRLGPLRLQIDGLGQPVDELSSGEALRLYVRGNHPLTRRPYRRAWRWLAIEPWRRLLCRVGQLRSRAGRPLTPRILHADVRVERFRLHAQYRPGIVRSPTVFFNARGTETDAAATWRPFFQGPLTVVETPDPHDRESIEAARQVILDHLKDMGDA